MEVSIKRPSNLIPTCWSPQSALCEWNRWHHPAPPLAIAAALPCTVQAELEGQTGNPWPLSVRPVLHLVTSSPWRPVLLYHMKKMTCGGMFADWAVIAPRGRRQRTVKWLTSHVPAAAGVILLSCVAPPFVTSCRFCTLHVVFVQPPRLLRSSMLPFVSLRSPSWQVECTIPVNQFLRWKLRCWSFVCPPPPPRNPPTPTPPLPPLFAFLCVCLSEIKRCEELLQLPFYWYGWQDPSGTETEKTRVAVLFRAASSGTEHNEPLTSR